MPLLCLCSPETFAPFNSPALVVGHPGHELKMFGWITEHRPQVHVITDGSGRQGVSRLPSTTKFLSAIDAEPGEIFGRVSDAGVYCALLETNIQFFLNLLHGLADSFIRREVDFVAGDASEGYNPTHDICRALINAAVELAEKATGRSIPNYEFRLTEWEQNGEDLHDSRCLHLRLEDDILRRKLKAAADYGELKEEVQRAITARGEQYFQIECLRKVSAVIAEDAHADEPGAKPYVKPYYESFGEKRVAEGEYISVIRYKEHMLPVLNALRDHVAGVRPIARLRNCAHYIAPTTIAS
jgi:hypothetical protein